MKIAIVGVDAPGALASMLGRGAAELGHAVTVVPAPRLISGWRPLVLARRASADALLARPLIAALERRLLAAEPELVVVVKGRFIRAAHVRALRRSLACPVLVYYPDHPLWPGFHEPPVVEALAEYDEVVVWGEHVRDALAAIGLTTTRVVPFAYDPQLYRPPSGPVAERWEVTLLGQSYPVRVPYVRALADRKLLVSGLGWPAAVGGDACVGGAGFGAEETCRAYWASAVALNILHECNVPAHNMRTFEVPASETVMVATRTPDHERLFGEEGAVLVDDAAEARERVLGLLADPDRRRAVAAEGCRRVAGHTYASRMAEVVKPWSA